MLYDNIKKLCEIKRISIHKLENDLGFSHAFIRKWNKSDPGVLKVKKVADYLGVTIEQLLGGESEEKVG